MGDDHTHYHSPIWSVCGFHQRDNLDNITDRGRVCVEIPALIVHTKVGGLPKIEPHIRREYKTVKDWVFDHMVLEFCINETDLGRGRFLSSQWWHQLAPIQKYEDCGHKYSRAGTGDGIGSSVSKESYG